MAWGQRPPGDDLGSQQMVVGSVHLHLFSYIFSTSRQMSQICVAFLENLFIEFTTYMVKRVTITQGK